MLPIPLLIGLLAASPAQEVLQPAAAPALRPAESPGHFVRFAPGPEHARLLVQLGEARRTLAGAPDDAARLAHRAQFDSTLASLRSGAAQTRASAEALAGQHLIGTSWLVPGIAVRPGADLEALRALPGVIAIEPIGWALPQIATAVDAQHHNATVAHQGIGTLGPITGAGVEIAVIDSGLDLEMAQTGRPHRAFYVDGDPANLSGGGIDGSRVLTSKALDAFSNSQPEDIHGHGTRVASAIGAEQWSNGLDVADSIAFGASLHNYKISDDNFIGAPASTFSMKAALEEALMHPEIRVANLSYDGDPSQYSFLSRAIDDVSNAGLFISLSAGNNGSDLTFAHGAYNAMTVGGSYEFAPFPYLTSAVGPLSSAPGKARMYPDIIANGDQVTTARLDAENVHILATGTSIAAGFVSGAAACLFQADPSLGSTAVKALLLAAAKKANQGDPNAAGHGYLKVGEAVEMVADGAWLQGTVPAQGGASVYVDIQAPGAYPIAVVWERVGFEAQDFAVTAYDPSGAFVKAVDLADDVEERFALPAAVAGTYRLELRAKHGNVGGELPFAVAAPMPAAIAGLPSPELVTPLEVPALVAPTAQNLIRIQGEHLDAVTHVAIGGHAVPFLVGSATELVIDMPEIPVFGTTPIDLFAPAGTATVMIDVVPVGIEATLPDFSPWGGTSVLRISSKPGDIHFVGYSSTYAPSEVPGIVDLAIGDGFLDFVLAGQVQIPSGQVFVDIPYLPSTFMPINLIGVFHVQTAVLDPSQPTFPLATSNVASTEVF